MRYNVVINSNNSAGGSNASNAEYTFDWSLFEEGAYELTFNFVASTSSVNKTLLISLDGIGSSMNNFTTNNSTAQRTITTIGTVNPIRNQAADFTYDGSNVFNPPVYLNSRPTSNRFTVYVRDTDLNLTDILVDYVLILSFKKI